MYPVIPHAHQIAGECVDRDAEHHVVLDAPIVVLVHAKDVVDAVVRAAHTHHVLAVDHHVHHVQMTAVSIVHLNVMAIVVAVVVTSRAIIHVEVHAVDHVRVRAVVDVNPDALEDADLIVPEDVFLSARDVPMCAMVAVAHVMAVQIVAKGAHHAVMTVVLRALINAVAHVLLNVVMHAKMDAILVVRIVVKFLAPRHVIHRV